MNNKGISYGNKVSDQNRKGNFDTTKPKELSQYSPQSGEYNRSGADELYEECEMTGNSEAQLFTQENYQDSNNGRYSSEASVEMNQAYEGSVSMAQGHNESLCAGFYQESCETKRLTKDLEKTRADLYEANRSISNLHVALTQESRQSKELANDLEKTRADLYEANRSMSNLHVALTQESHKSKELAKDLEKTRADLNQEREHNREESNRIKTELETLKDENSQLLRGLKTLYSHELSHSPGNEEQVQYHFFDSGFEDINRDFFLHNVVKHNENTPISKSTGNPRNCKLLVCVLYRANMRMEGSYNIEYVKRYIEAGSKVILVLLRYQRNDREFQCQELKDNGVTVYELDVDIDLFGNKGISGFVGESGKNTRNWANLQTKLEPFRERVSLYKRFSRRFGFN